MAGVGVFDIVRSLVALLSKVEGAPCLTHVDTQGAQQAANNTKEQFANSPDLKTELMNAIIGALDAHTLMSTQALNSEAVRGGLKDVLLDHAGLWEDLRARAAS